MALNYHHLYLFWATAHEGGVSAASRKLHLSQPTISAQIRTLEDHLGEQLFDRRGRRLELTDAGRLALQYADEIFSLGREFEQNLAGVSTTRPKRLHVGIADVLPKVVSHRLLEPALMMDPPTHLICEEDKTDRLLAELSIQRLDLVLSDAPIRAGVRVRAFNHLLGECGVTFFGTKRLARSHRSKFPESLDGAPMLLPTEDTLMRRNLERFFDKARIRPRIVAEFHDSALLKVFGRAGDGIFAAASVIEAEITSEYQVEIIGQTDEVRERFYAITVERRVKHPAVLAITDAAKNRLFTEKSKRKRARR